MERIIVTLAAKWWHKLLFFLLFSSLSYILIYSTINNFFGYSVILSPALLLLLISLPAFLVEKYIPGSKWFLIGMLFNSIEKKNILASIVITIVGFTLITCVILMFGSRVSFFTYWDSLGIMQIVYIIFINVVIEELIYRGVLLRYLSLKFSVLTSIIIVSIVFTIVHLFNPEISILGLLNTFFFSLIISYFFLRTNSLTSAIIIHSAWNLFQALILGWTLSGINFYYSISQFTKHDLPDIISGGYFGLEASLVVTFVLIVNAFLYHKYLKINPEFNALIFKRDYSKG
jgi:membrane protease YdiL (CAAX protease family)